MQELELDNEQLRSDNDDFRGEIDDLHGEMNTQKGLLTKQIDNGLCDHIVFHGIPKGSCERNWDWEHTTRLLAE